MLLTLTTLKSRPFEEQVDTIELVTAENLDLFDRLKLLLRGGSDDRVLQVTLSNDREKVVRVALLAVMAADIVSLPDARRRAPYEVRLMELCQHFDVDYRDVVIMVGHGRAIEKMLENGAV